MILINLTTNLKLGKPTSEEKYDIKMPNADMDIIDSSIKKLQDADHNFASKENFQAHANNKNNPHGVTKQQLGLDRVVNRQQIYGLPGAVTSGGIPVFDGNGYTVRDSGFTIGTSVPPDAAFTDTTYGIADKNIPGIVKSSDSIQVSSDGTASVINDSHLHDTQYYAKAEAARIFFLNSNISQSNENEASRVPSCALLHEIIQQKDLQIENLKNEIHALSGNLGNTVSAYVTKSITLPANMEDYIELCRTPALQPGTYLIYYRMSNFSNDTVYQILRSSDRQYISIFSGQNGMDTVTLSTPCAMIIVARNRGDAYTVGASGNNRLSAMRIK